MWGDNKDRALEGTTTSSISNRITKAKFCNLVKMSAEQQKRWELEERIAFRVAMMTANAQRSGFK